MTASPVSDRPDVRGGRRRAAATAVARLLGLLQHRLAGGVRRELKTVPMTPQLAAVLEVVDARPGIGQHELADELGGAFHSRVVVWLDELGERGWVLRTTDRSDRRRRRVWPTAAGRRAAREARRLSTRPALEATAALDDEELETLRELLSRMAERPGGDDLPSSGDPRDRDRPGRPGVRGRTDPPDRTENPHGTRSPDRTGDPHGTDRRDLRAPRDPGPD